MLKNLVAAVKANKETLIKKGAIAVGTVIGLVVAAVIVKNVVSSEDGESMVDTSSEQPFDVE